MCEYCGCQALASIELLTREHDTVRELADRAAHAADAGDVDTTVALARQMRDLLGPHTAVEEQALFVAMARDYPDHVAELEAEHRLVEAAIDEATGDHPGQGWPRRFAAAMRTLSRHAFKEQDGLFPAALATLDATDWDLVDAVRAEVGSVLDVSS